MVDDKITLQFLLLRKEKQENVIRKVSRSRAKQVQRTIQFVSITVSLCLFATAMGIAKSEMIRMVWIQKETTKIKVNIRGSMETQFSKNFSKIYTYMHMN